MNCLLIIFCFFSFLCWFSSANNSIKHYELRISKQMNIETKDIFTNQTLFPRRIFPPGSHDEIASIYEIPNGSFSFEGYYSMFYDQQQQLLHNISGHAHYYGYKPDDPTLHRLHHINISQTIENHHLFVIKYTACHYWHFQVEIISQLYLLSLFYEQFHPNWTSDNLVIAIMTSDHIHPMCYEILTTYLHQLPWLSMLNYPSTDHPTQDVPLLYLKPEVLYHISPGYNVYATSKTSTDVPRLFSLNAMSLLGQKFHQLSSTTGSQPRKRYFIGREAKYTRQISNIHDIESILQKYSIDIYYPEHHGTDFITRIQNISQVELFISPCGTGFSANVPFLNPNQTVLVELFAWPPHTATGRIAAQHLHFKQHIPLICLYADPNKPGNQLINVTHFSLGIEQAIQSLV